MMATLAVVLFAVFLCCDATLSPEPAAPDDGGFVPYVASFGRNANTYATVNFTSVDIKSIIINHLRSKANYCALKRRCRHFDDIFVKSCTESFQNDNLQCSHWRKCHQNDNISVSLWIFIIWCHGWFKWPGPPFTNMVSTLIPAWISNYTHYNVWDEITYPFLNFNGATVEVYEWISNFIPHFTMHVITYPCWD